ncbi:MAG TPA: HlyD family secretion protein [Rhodopila sp.]|nr:HlyD family secretion protein [Rhodopila sp.]
MDADARRRHLQDDDRQPVDSPSSTPVAEQEQAPRRADDDAGRRDEDTQSRRDKSGDQDKSGDNKNGGGGKKRRWPLIVLGIVVVLAVLGGVGYWYLTRNEESTVDAYTEGNAISFAAKVTGYVTALNVNDNTFVKKDDVLLKIDPRDYVAARDQAQAALDLAKSQLSSARVDLEITEARAPATLAQAKAQLETARANQRQAQRDYNRLRAVDPRARTQTSLDQATAQLKANDAAIQSAQAQVNAASVVQQTIQAAKDTVKQREAQVEQAQANLESAEVNLSYTVLRAPQDGYITRRNVDLGTFLQAGQQVFYIVTTTVWVVANFKETQLTRMHPGQAVTMHVDAYPQLKLHGHIDSIQQGSGARFSAFPAENATGNFVKIVRRVPVKIDIDSGLPPNQPPLPLGLSVEPTVQLK